MVPHFSKIILALLMLSAVSRGETEIFFAEDVSPFPPGNNEVPRQSATKSLSMAATFRSRLADVTTETFESFPDGDMPAILHFGDNTTTLSADCFIWAINSPGSTRSGVFPSSGTKVLTLLPSSSLTVATIAFSSPQSAFGFFATDVEENQFSVILTDAVGNSRTIPVPVTVPQGSGGACYFGVIDRLEPFVSVKLVNTGTKVDGFAFDDLIIGTPSQVIQAEPAKLAIQLQPEITGVYPEITISGTPGAHYRLQYAVDLASPAWITLEDILLPALPYLYHDASPVSASPRRFYRAFPVE